MTHRWFHLVTVGALAAVAGSSVLAAPKNPAGTSLSKPRKDGTVLIVTTGTNGGECTVHGDTLFCEDGERVASADVDEGCIRTSAGARCAIVQPREPLPIDEEPGPAMAQSGSGSDIECETGKKRGNVYSLSDGDGKGGCAATRDHAGRINGAVCTKNDAECATMTCDQGCLGGGAGCDCKLKSSKGSAQTQK